MARILILLRSFLAELESAEPHSPPSELLHNPKPALPWSCFAFGRALQSTEGEISPRCSGLRRRE